MTRLELDDELRLLLGNSHTYFDPPESIKMKYPCFVYSMDDMDQKWANNHHYLDKNRYSITYITKDVESDIAKRFFEAFPASSFERKYSADNLWHYVFSLYC